MIIYILTTTDVLSAGVALGHAGEWDALRDYLKSSYKASRLGQVSNHKALRIRLCTMKWCVSNINILMHHLFCSYYSPW